MASSAVLLATVAFLGGICCQEPKPEHNLEIVFFDVGPGSATLIRTPERRTCLIDGGPTYAGANDICPILDSLGITELDYCAATNYTEGRIGGLDEVVRYLGGERGIINQCLDRGRAASGPAFAEYRQAVGKRREAIKVGQTITLGDVKITCLARNGRVLGTRYRTPKVEEDRSIALRVSYCDFDLLIPGDLSAAADGPRLDLLSELAEVCDEVELLAVGDFGSARASSFRTLEQLNPVASVISVGPNQDSLPSPRTVNRLLKYRRKLYQTNRAGNSDLPQRGGRVVNGNIWVTVTPRFFTVAGDTFWTFR